MYSRGDMLNDTHEYVVWSSSVAVNIVSIFSGNIFKSLFDWVERWRFRKLIVICCD